jgi:hypothetical protein
VIFGEIARDVGLGRRCVAGGGATCVVDLSIVREAYHEEEFNVHPPSRS